MEKSWGGVWRRGLVASVWGILLLAGASIRAQAQEVPILVTQCELDTFEIANFDHTLDPPNGAEVGDATTASGTSGTFVSGPGTPPMGSGSFTEKIGTSGDPASGADGSRLQTNICDGLLLSDIVGLPLSYSTYVTSFGGAVHAISIALRIDLDGDGATDDVLVFDPVFQNGTYPMITGPAVPDQCVDDPIVCVVAGSWQFWDTAIGGWWSMLASGGGPPLITLASYAATHPGAAVALESPALRLFAGEGGADWAGFEGSVDGLRACGNLYDFEPGACATPTPGPTPTPTPAPTPSPSPSPTAQPTPTPTPTPTPEPTASPAPTPNPTPEPTASPTPTATPTPEPTASPAPTPTPTPEPTASPAPTPTPTPEPTASPAPTPTPTPEPTASPAPTPTPTPQPTASPAPTPTPTPAPTASPAPTPTPTPEPTASPAPTPTPTPVATSSPTPSPEPTVPVCHHPCPDKIRRRPTGDLLQVRSGFAPTSALDPSTEPFEIIVRNASGILYQATLSPGDFVKSTNGFTFKDLGARRGQGIRNGLSAVRIAPVPGGTGTRVNVDAFADLAAAADPLMTVEIRVGARRIAYTETWSPRRYGWQLSHR